MFVCYQLRSATLQSTQWTFLFCTRFCTKCYPIAIRCGYHCDSKNACGHVTHLLCVRVQTCCEDSLLASVIFSGYILVLYVCKYDSSGLTSHTLKDCVFNVIRAQTYKNAGHDHMDIAMVTVTSYSPIVIALPLVESFRSFLAGSCFGPFHLFQDMRVVVPEAWLGEVGTRGLVL